VLGVAVGLIGRHHGAMTADEQVRAANAAYYAAFEAFDLDAMSAAWEHSDRVSVTHPGWPTLRGWARVIGSWEAIFSNTDYIQFVLTDEVVTVVGEVAWVTLDENILQSSGSPDGGGADTEELSGARIAATNVYVRGEEGWQMLLHHGSPVSTPEPS
jgi:ketosteroid isomerase-like protein